MRFKGQYPLCRELSSWGSSRAWRLQRLSVAGFGGFAEEVVFRFCSGSVFSGLYCRTYFLFVDYYFCFFCWGGARF